MAAVQQDGRALEYADPDLKKDPEIVLAAVQQDGRALEYADPELKKDPEIVLWAVANNESVLQYVAEELKPDIERRTKKRKLGVQEYAVEASKIVVINVNSVERLERSLLVTTATMGGATDTFEVTSRLTSLTNRSQQPYCAQY